MDKEDQSRAEEAIQDAVEAAVLLIRDETDRAMNLYNAKK
jgi:hypothetical protein